MTKLPADLEALMPEPNWYSPTLGDAAHFPHFTADQVREFGRAIWEAATERAAKLCDSMSGSDYSPAQCAAAIRGSI